jgi:hypothetical protein
MTVSAGRQRALTSLMTKPKRKRLRAASSMTVSDDGHAQAARSSHMTSRREQVCEATARHRRRRKHGLFWRPIMVTKDQLDQLEVRGYLDPDRRGDRLDECGTIEMFLGDSLRKG